MHIEKRCIIDSNKLSGESYFASILREAYAHGLVNDSDVENIQLQCMELLACKVNEFNAGGSSSIRVETAESIMMSNLYTLGLYLKSLHDADCAAATLKKTMIAELYHQGRLLINVRKSSAKRIYARAKANKAVTLNEAYNSTLDDQGIGIFFRLYDPNFAAHEVPGSIDYQLCNPVSDLTGIEFIEKYLGNLFLENEFCSYFEPEDIHHLLCGYDEGYKDLLINVFEQLLTATVGCVLTNRPVTKLNVPEQEIRHLYDELSKNDDQQIALKIFGAKEKILDELNITSFPLHRYIAASLPKITAYIVRAVRMNSLNKTFVSPSFPELKTSVQFVSGMKMDDEDYRELIDELLICRHSSDKHELIKEKVKSFGDLEDLLFDAMLGENEIVSVFETLGNIEMAELIKRHPFQPDVQAVDLSVAELDLREILKRYLGQLPTDRREQILEIVDLLQ